MAAVVGGGDEHVYVHVHASGGRFGGLSRLVFARRMLDNVRSCHRGDSETP